MVKMDADEGYFLWWREDEGCLLRKKKGKHEGTLAVMMMVMMGMNTLRTKGML